jgi:asparagine synthase (glutamine-hydrolysing)
LLGRTLQGWHGGAGRIPRFGSILAASGPAGICQAVVSRWQKPSRIVRGACDVPELSPPPIPSLPGDQIENDMMLRDMRYYLPDDILHKVDRASMANSLEAREPLLDHRLIELAWRLPLDMKVRGGVTKWPMRELLRQELPETLYERPKQGFGVPISSWLRNDLRPWAEELLNSTAASGFFDVTVVRELWREHLLGRSDRGSYLWDVLVFLKWQESLATDRHGNGSYS